MIQPLTIGLLASALMRYDHALFAPWHADDILQRMAGPPEQRIPAAIDAVIAIYDDLKAGTAKDNVTVRQLAEEFGGVNGFWRPEREDGYAKAFDPYALRDLALARIGRRGDTA